MIKYLVFDTETESKNYQTDDINVHDHYPFMCSYEVLDEKFNVIHSDYFYLKDKIKYNIFFDYLKQVPTLVGANIKYDVHMFLNEGVDPSIFCNKNYIDIQVLARLVINHDKQTDASFGTALKKLAVKYLGIDSNQEERILKNELSGLKQKHKQKFKEYLIRNNLWNNNLTKTFETTLLNDLYDNWFKVFHKYPQYKSARSTFFSTHHRPSYADCRNVETYAMTDAILTRKLFKLWYPMVARLKQIPALMRTSEATWPLILMERKGLTVDIEKLMEHRRLLVREIDKVHIYSPIDGTEISADQNAKLKEIYEYESGMSLPSADEKVRKLIADVSPTACIVSYKKKLLKYLNSYVSRILSKLTKVGNEYKVYTQYKLAGTITGRLSSDFQQFPKEPLILETGEEISIRSWFKVPEEDKYMFFFD